MAVVVIGDITNLSCFINKENVCEVTDAIESLFCLYIVCYFWKRKRNWKVIYIYTKHYYYISSFVFNIKVFVHNCWCSIIIVIFYMIFINPQIKIN